MAWLEEFPERPYRAAAPPVQGARGTNGSAMAWGVVLEALKADALRPPGARAAHGPPCQRVARDGGAVGGVMSASAARLLLSCGAFLGAGPGIGWPRPYLFRACRSIHVDQSALSMTAPRSILVFDDPRPTRRRHSGYAPCPVKRRSAQFSCGC